MGVILGVVPGRSRPLQLIAVVLSAVLYLVVAFLFGGESGVVLMLVILPTIVSAYVYELRGGIIAGAVGAVINIAILLTLWTDPLAPENLVPSTIGAATNLLLGAMIGSNRSLLSRLRTAQAKIEHLATIDPLTGLSNRRQALAVLSEAIDASRRHGFDLTVATIDLDNLKVVNDSRGHAAGDDLLKTFATAAELSVRSSDTVCRIGGDEFLLVLPYCGLGCAGRVLRRVERGFVKGWTGVDEAQFSTGITTFADGDTVEDLMDRSDQHMFENKRRRKAGEPAVWPDEQDCAPGGQRPVQ